MACCRSCQHEVKWAIVKASGKRIPLEPEPSPTGTYEIVGSRPTEFGTTPLVRSLRGDQTPLLPGFDTPRYLAHHARCPFASRHRSRSAA
jgi:hypothetical protein